MADFQQHLAELSKLGVSVVAGSVDTKDDAQQIVSELGLVFPVAYALDAIAIARTYGCFYEEGDRFLHATGFVVEPSGMIAVASYSTGAIGRLRASDCLALISHLKQAGQSG